MNKLCNHKHLFDRDRDIQKQEIPGILNNFLEI